MAEMAIRAYPASPYTWSSEIDTGIATVSLPDLYVSEPAALRAATELRNAISEGTACARCGHRGFRTFAGPSGRRLRCSSCGMAKS